MTGRWHVLLAAMAAGMTGCAAFPDIRHGPRYHNPFPQLHRVAVLPFFNLSAEPTLDTRVVTRIYYEELQKIPGFEVMPPGVVDRYLEGARITLTATTDYHKLARDLGVDAVIRGAVTDYSPYYPPRLGIAVDWFAANPGFHPIPPGYGLPWGTPLEEYIPEDVLFEAEFALAREQLKTQTPDPESGPDDGPPPLADGSGLPPDWPDPSGFVPPGPSPVRPPLRPQHEPIITHTRLYDSRDLRVTERLARYVDFLDDARFDGWQGYLVRSEDFIRFCCYSHVTESLALRGGVGKSRVLWRWPLSRYIP